MEQLLRQAAAALVQPAARPSGQLGPAAPLPELRATQAVHGMAALQAGDCKYGLPGAQMLKRTAERAAGESRWLSFCAGPTTPQHTPQGLPTSLGCSTTQ
jgi:hypothetical protein